MESPFPVDIKHTEYTNCMIYVITYMAIVLTSFFRQPVKDTVNHSKNGQCPNVLIWTANYKSRDAQHTCCCSVVLLSLFGQIVIETLNHNMHGYYSDVLIRTAINRNSDT